MHYVDNITYVIVWVWDFAPITIFKAGENKHNTCGEKLQAISLNIRSGMQKR